MDPAAALACGVRSIYTPDGHNPQPCLGSFWFRPWFLLPLQGTSLPHSRPHHTTSAEIPGGFPDLSAPRSSSLTLLWVTHRCSAPDTEPARNPVEGWWTFVDGISIYESCLSNYSDGEWDRNSLGQGSRSTSRDLTLCSWFRFHYKGIHLYNKN